MIAEDNDLILGIEESWSTDYLVAMRGWVLSKTGPVEGMEVCINGVQIPVTWYPRPDVLAAYANPGNANCGFVVEIPRVANHEATFKVETQGSTLLKTMSIQGMKPKETPDFSDGGPLWNDFIQKVNGERLRVLEIGSRIVSPGSVSKRSLFPDAASYTGFDYYPDANTDVVGDAHQLSKYFGNQKFDAVFSLSVLEHLAMPWLAAREINKILEVGGLVYHSTHNAWPIHEQPWDFWRFSDEALKVLFSPALGFEIIKAGYFEPVRIYFAESKTGTGQETLPTHAAFGGVAILARKVADCDSDRFQWNATVEEILGAESHYPSPATLQPQKTETDRSTSSENPNGNPTEDSTENPLENNTDVHRQSMATAPSVNVQSGTVQSVQSVDARSKDQETIQRLRKRVENLKTKLEASENEIAAMKTSKFWKIRSSWMKLKTKLLGDS